MLTGIRQPLQANARLQSSFSTSPWRLSPSLATWAARPSGYTRNLNDVTARVPEIVEVARASPWNALILDGEAIALKPDGSPRSFQVTMRRFGRKLEVEAMRRELPLSVFLRLSAEGR